jgi:CDP-diacylglycerol--serine O-phosphatidyltransferase
MLWDGLDGRVARLTNTQSEFGAQYDSMADMVSFGVAPALLVYFWMFGDLGKLGWIAAFIYVAGGALRLARFNTQIGIEDKRYFQGLPSPAAAALVAGMVSTKEMIGTTSYDFAIIYVAWVILVGAGILMVSNIRYYSFKEVNLKGRASFKLLLASILIIIIIIFKPSAVLFIFFLVYALSGLIMTSIEVRKKRQLKKRLKHY